MKKIGFYFCALVALALFSCEKAPVNDLNPLEFLPEKVAEHITKNFPDATIIWTEGEKDDEFVRVALNDEIGNEYRVAYRNGEWKIIEKRFAVKDPLQVFPDNVLATYLKTGVGHEEFAEDCYIAVISRRDQSWKQYEICCQAPYIKDDGTMDQLQHHIVIAEDGTLLTHSYSRFSSAIRVVEIRPAIDTIYKKYGLMPIMGVVNEGLLLPYITIFVNDGENVKAIKFLGYWHNSEVDEYKWLSTEWALPLDTTLPDDVQWTIDYYKSRHPGMELTGLSMIEHVNGFSYGFTFGTGLYQDYWAMDIKND
jgi:hypothetical protein